MSHDPYKGSNYDAAGMPLGTKVVDCDEDREQRRFATVKQIIPLPEEQTVTLNDIDYTPPKTQATKEFNKRRNLDQSKFNEAIKKGVNVPGADLDSVTEAKAKDKADKEAEGRAKAEEEAKAKAEAEKEDKIEGTSKEEVVIEEDDDTSFLEDDSKDKK